MDSLMLHIYASLSSSLSAFLVLVDMSLEVSSIGYDCTIVKHAYLYRAH